MARAPDVSPLIPPRCTTKMDGAEQWILELIAQGNIHQFYTSPAWVALSMRVRETQHNECQRCKAKGYYVPCDVVHHRQYLRRRPDLALHPDNLECLCHECHNKEHGKTNVFLTEERW